MREKVEFYIYNKVKRIGFLKRILSFVYKILISNPKQKRVKIAYRNNAVSVLGNAKSALDEADIVFWLDYGTMLGAYRDNGFISHDNDIDISVFYTDYNRVQSAMEKRGFKLIHQYSVEKEGLEQTYLLDGVSIDVFFYKLANDKTIFCNTFTMLDNVYYGNLDIDYQVLVKEISIPFEGFKKINFYGEDYNIPANVEDCLVAHYGKGYMTPDPNFDYKKEATNITYYSIEEKFGVYRKFIS